MMKRMKVILGKMKRMKKKVIQTGPNKINVWMGLRHHIECRNHHPLPSL
jgi:hypothetical protein